MELDGVSYYRQELNTSAKSLVAFFVAKLTVIYYKSKHKCLEIKQLKHLYSLHVSLHK
jgi:hypothetical protein